MMSLEVSGGGAFRQDLPTKDILSKPYENVRKFSDPLIVLCRYLLYSMA